jgi:predicted PurR-regulated permease PerM
MSPFGRQRSPEERHILAMLRWLLYIAFAVIAYAVLRVLGPLLVPLLAAAAIAYLLDGWVDAMARRIPRTAAVGLLLVGFIAVVAALLFVVVPLVSQEIARFAAALPALVERAAALLSEKLGIEVPRDWRAALQGEDVRAFLESAVGPASQVAAAALGGVLGFLAWLAELLLVPVFAFYILVDWDSIVARLHALVPPRHRERTADLAREIDGVVSIWIRGQLMVMAILAALYATAFKLIGLHLGITVGILVGLLTVIPFLGTVVGAGLALLMLLLDWQGPSQLAAVGVSFLVLHLVEAAVLTPRLVGKRVGLGEVGALFAVLAGGQLLGFTGVLLAVPIAASVAVLIRRAVAAYEGSRFFTDGDQLVAALDPPPPVVARPGPTRDLRRRRRQDPDTVPDPQTAAALTSVPAESISPGPEQGGGTVEAPEEPAETEPMPALQLVSDPEAAAEPVAPAGPEKERSP